MATRRKERINEALRRMVSQKIVSEVKDPRVGFVTITRVEIYPDMSGADVWVTMLDEDELVKEECLRALNRMRGFFQKDIGNMLKTRLTPRLHFKYDIGVQKSVELDQLIQKARSGDIDHSENAQNPEEDIDNDSSSEGVEAKDISTESDNDSSPTQNFTEQ
ncbi:MAG: 30S ribosome-binding factor RbfA [Planctomycetes bacterium]|nr:30S ribosome-binding factor RbfA [Planctomycetota bacterium]